MLRRDVICEKEDVLYSVGGMWKSIEIFVASEGITLDPTAYNVYIAMILYSNDGLRGVSMILVQLSLWYEFTKLSLVDLFTRYQHKISD